MIQRTSHILWHQKLCLPSRMVYASFTIGFLVLSSRGAVVICCSVGPGGAVVALKVVSGWKVSLFFLAVCSRQRLSLISSFIPTGHASPRCIIESCPNHCESQYMYMVVTSKYEGLLVTFTYTVYCCFMPTNLLNLLMP